MQQRLRNFIQFDHPIASDLIGDSLRTQPAIFSA